MARRFLIILILTGALFPLGFTFTDVDENTVDFGLEPVEDFLKSTIRRYNDAWALSKEEFEKAKVNVQEMPEKFSNELKEKVDKAVKETVEEKLNSSGLQNL